MTCSEIYTNRVARLKTLLLSPLASSAENLNPGYGDSRVAVTRVGFLHKPLACISHLVFSVFCFFEKRKDYNNSSDHVLFGELQFQCKLPSSISNNQSLLRKVHRPLLQLFWKVALCEVTEGSAGRVFAPPPPPAACEIALGFFFFFYVLPDVRTVQQRCLLSAAGCKLRAKHVALWGVWRDIFGFRVVTLRRVRCEK